METFEGVERLKWLEKHNDATKIQAKLQIKDGPSSHRILLRFMIRGLLVLRNSKSTTVRLRRLAPNHFHITACANKHCTLHIDVYTESAP